MATFEQYKTKKSSEKIVLSWLEPSQRLFGWTETEESSSIFYASVDWFVLSVNQNTVSLTKVDSLEDLNTGSFYFDANSKTLFVKSFGSVDPTTVWTEVTYRLFFSNTPISLPFDLGTGKEVPYQPRIQGTSSVNAAFDAEQKGIALEGEGSITLLNSDRYFAPIYDKLNWQSKSCRVFSYARDLSPSDAVTLFTGTISNKAYMENAVTFSIKDFVFKLRSNLDLPLYSEEDGVLPDSLIGQAKRRLYGRVDGLLCDPTDIVGRGFDLVEIDSETDTRTDSLITASLTQNSNVATFSSLDIHGEIVSGDDIEIEGQTFRVRSLSRVEFGLNKSADVTFSRPTGTTVRIAFDDLETANVEVGDHISISGLSNAGPDLKTRVIGLFPIAAVSADTYIEFTLPTTVSDVGFGVIKVDVGEIAITKASNSTSVFLQRPSNVTISNKPVIVKSAVPYRRKNRRFFLAHHALSESEKTIVAINTGVKVTLNSISDLEVGDTVRFDSGFQVVIAGIDTAANIITTTNTILPIPPVGSKLRRLSIQRVTHKNADLVAFRDYLPTNSAELGTSISLATDAEFNIAQNQSFDSEVFWLEGSKQVLGSNNIFRRLSPRDWIRSETNPEWYEIAEKFSDNIVILTKPYVGGTGSNLTQFKQPLYIGDESKVIANVYGKTVDGTPESRHISTGALVVRDLLKEIGLESSLNNASFETASNLAPFMVSMAIPQEKGQATPTFRDTINKINETIFGSLYSNLEQAVEYRVLDATRKLEDAARLNDFEIIGQPEVETDSSNILERVSLRFGFKDADTVTESYSFSVSIQESEYVKQSGISGQNRTGFLYLFRRKDADLIAKRLLFINELSKSTLTFECKLQLADAVLNDLVEVNLDNLYSRLGSSEEDRAKLGLINSISKNGLFCNVQIDDLGNIFNRVCVISPNNAPDYAEASAQQKRFSSFMTDENSLVDDESSSFNSNLIG